VSSLVCEPCAFTCGELTAILYFNENTTTSRARIYLSQSIRVRAECIVLRIKEGRLVDIPAFSSSLDFALSNCCVISISIEGRVFTGAFPADSPVESIFPFLWHSANKVCNFNIFWNNSPVPLSTPISTLPPHSSIDAEPHSPSPLQKCQLLLPNGRPLDLDIPSCCSLNVLLAFCAFTYCLDFTQVTFPSLSPRDMPRPVSDWTNWPISVTGPTVTITIDFVSGETIPLPDISIFSRVYDVKLTLSDSFFPDDTLRLTFENRVLDDAMQLIDLPVFDGIVLTGEKTAVGFHRLYFTGLDDGLRVIDVSLDGEERLGDLARRFAFASRWGVRGFCTRRSRSSFHATPPAR
jgi:hypothetical protein